jgi:hypothetical protein
MTEPQIQLNNLILTEHPVWPAGIQSVVFYGTKFNFEEPLVFPDTVKSVHIDNCEMRSRLQLSDSVTSFHYGLMSADNFPEKFPAGLRVLSVRKFKGASLPEIPQTVEQIRLLRVHLETPFTRLPIYLNSLSLCQTNITEFEEFPIGLTSIRIEECRVQRLPRLNPECNLRLIDSEVKKRD